MTAPTTPVGQADVDRAGPDLLGALGSAIEAARRGRRARGHDVAHPASPEPASTTPVARPSSTGRSGAGTNAAGEEAGIGLLAASVSACLVCGAPAVPGDDVALCKPHGGLGPAWAGFDEAAWLAGREAC